MRNGRSASDHSLATTSLRKSWGIPPFSKEVRPTTGSWGEYAWLWLLIFVASMLFAWGVIGL
ncbi:MAG: hypothetical protein IMW89_15660 [Ktedonobacteraceae bacterium]|nr:hypothetical protein [Ktedonobacteraceae bacterium]